MAEIRNTYYILVRTPEGKREIGRPRRRCEYNIKMDLMAIGFVWLRVGLSGRL
jgi:hypothetical protein